MTVTMTMTMQEKQGTMPLLKLYLGIAKILAKAHSEKSASV